MTEIFDDVPDIEDDSVDQDGIPLCSCCKEKPVMNKDASYCAECNQAMIDDRKRDYAD